MGWLQEFIGKLLLNQAPEQRQNVADPFNFLLDLYLHFYQGVDEVLIEKVLARFPVISREEAEHLFEKITEAYTYAMSCQYHVRDGLLSAEQAESAIKSAFPQLDAINLRALVVQTQIGANR